jgi:hypothetical protein
MQLLFKNKPELQINSLVLSGAHVTANTALEDAALLCKRLVEAHDGRRDLLEAIHSYEGDMLEYSRHVVLESLRQMDERDVIHKPVIGRAVLALTRTMMRVVNRLPLLKRLMQRKQMELRKISDAAAIERQRAQMA